MAWMVLIPKIKPSHLVLPIIVFLSCTLLILSLKSFISTFQPFKKQALKQLMLEKEAELALTNNELAELEEYQTLQRDQQEEIT